MTNTIFYILVTILFMNFSLGSMQYSGINRTFMLIYKGVFENSLVTVDDEGNPISPYFDRTKLINFSEEYFGLNMPKYVTKYTTSYLFYESETEKYCLSQFCNGVKISLRAEINGLFHYEKAKTFYVQETNYSK